jgi:hypothetical protein
MSNKRQLSAEEKAMAAAMKAAIAAIPGMTEERLGVEVGVSQGAISHWTGGRLPVPAIRAPKVAASLGFADPAQISVAYRNVTGFKVAEDAPIYRVRAMHLDPTKIAETVTALRIVFARRGAVYEIASPPDAEIFIQAYAIRELMPKNIKQDDLIERVASIVPIRGKDIGRSDDIQAGRTHRGATRKRTGGKA